MSVSPPLPDPGAEPVPSPTPSMDLAAPGEWGHAPTPPLQESPSSDGPPVLEIQNQAGPSQAVRPMLLGEAPHLSPALRRSRRAGRNRLDLSGTESDRSSAARPVARVVPQMRQKTPSPPRRRLRRRPEPARTLEDGSFDTEIDVSPLHSEEEQGQ